MSVRSIRLWLSHSCLHLFYIGLKVILNINQDEYISTGNDAAGARIVIHSQDKMPYPEDEGLLVKPGMLTSVHVSQVGYT